MRVSTLSTERSQSPASVSRPVPNRVAPEQPKAPDTHWMVRGAGALLQGRLPHRFQGPFDQLMRRLGKPFRRVKIGQYRALVRRGASWDDAAVQRILGGHDYARPGHEIRPTDT